MRQGWLWAIVIGMAVLLIVVIVVLYLLGGDEQAPLERLRDISLVFISIAAVLMIMLMAALVGVAVWLALLIKDNVIPLLEQLTATASRVRGTSQFVSEEVASPIISAYSTVSGLRAMIRTVTTGTESRRARPGARPPGPNGSGSS